MHPHNIHLQVHPLPLVLPILSLPYIRDINHLGIVRQHLILRHVFDTKQYLQVRRELRVVLVVAEDGDGGDAFVVELGYVLDEQEGESAADWGPGRWSAVFDSES
jgi:hypothetical protein